MKRIYFSLIFICFFAMPSGSPANSSPDSPQLSRVLFSMPNSQGRDECSSTPCNDDFTCTQLGCLFCGNLGWCYGARQGVAFDGTPNDSSGILSYGVIAENRSTPPDAIVAAQDFASSIPCDDDFTCTQLGCHWCGNLGYCFCR